MIVYSEGRVEGLDHCLLPGEGLKVYILFTPRVGLKVFLIVYSEGRVEGLDH